MEKKKKKEFVGVGQESLKLLNNKVGINTFTKLSYLKTSQRIIVSKLKNSIGYSNTLKIKLKKSVEFFKTIKNYRGMRHLYNYPVRGQRTHTNAKTRKKLKKLVVTLKSIKKVYVQKKN
jgi:small subunit ribosomal protein S13